MKNHPIYIVFIMLLFASCEGAFEQVLTIDIPEHESKISVGAHLSKNDTLFSVWTAQSLGILDTASYQPLKDAAVKLYYEDELLHELSFSPDDGQRFVKENNNELLAGTYRLEITDPTYGTASAEQVLPVATPINTVEYTEDGTLSPDGERVDEIKVIFDDPADENYYLITAEMLIRYEWDSTEIYHERIYLDSNDPNISYAEGGLLFSDGTFNGSEYTLLLNNYNYFEEGAEMVGLNMVLESVSKDRFLFLKSLSSYYDANGNPFAEPVVVHGNIENGYGIFTLSAKSDFFLEL